MKLFCMFCRFEQIINYIDFSTCGRWETREIHGDSGLYFRFQYEFMIFIFLLIFPFFLLAISTEIAKVSGDPVTMKTSSILEKCFYRDKAGKKK